MISAIEWVPAGVADPNPKKYEFSPAELELIKMMEDQKIDEQDDDVESEEEMPEAKKTTKTKLPKIENTLPADLRMDEYSSDEDDENDAIQGTTIGNLLLEDPDHEDSDVDDEDEEAAEEDEKMNDENSDDSEDDDDEDDLADVPDTREYTPIDVEGLTSLGLSHVGTNAPTYLGDDDDEEDSDAEDVQIQAGDAIVVVAKTEEDFASLEVHVYEQKTGNLFVHHDIPLPAFPLCLAHGDISPQGTAGNFCAVGTFTPGIEIWNLDVLNALEPSCILGGEDTSMADEIMRHNMINAGKKNKKKLQLSSGPSLRAGSHTDAVMALSWNKVHRQVLASGSADCTVKLWDVTRANTDQANVSTFTHHKDKVQAVLWHPKEGTLLATGSYDRTVALVDARSQENIKKVKLPADCEALAWDPFTPEYLTAASEDGTITCWDVRKFSDKTPLWSIVANEFGGVSDLSYNPNVPGMLATCSVDKTVTLWDIYNDSENPTTGPPKPCGNKDMQVGKLYTINFYPSSPWLMGCAGSGKELAIWDMTREISIQKRFATRIGSEPVFDDADADGNDKKAAFDAMMSATTTTTTKDSAELTKQKKKGDNKNNKKKAHKVRR